ncbi:MAG: hypothetical protein DRP85_00265 [Candidatus Makaraimicrobium thalassicum]|nr:MAG: hypothetical protein DRP85_00265 [Candidatus Omnitrophota bacterium]
MKRSLIILAAAFLLIGISVQADAQGDIKWSQKPDWAEGYDILSYDTKPLVADDFECLDGKPVTDIHWWGSYTDDPGTDQSPSTAFQIKFWRDVPATTTTFSHPGQCLHTVDIDAFSGYKDDWQILAEHHGYRWDANITWSPFDQTQGTIYWISIAAQPDPANPNDESYKTWGWKTSNDHWNDEAVVDKNGQGIWESLGEHKYNQGKKIDMAFELTTPEPVSSVLFLMGGVSLAYFGRKRRRSVRG